MPHYPKERNKKDPKDYERVPVNDFVSGVIEEVQYDPSHNFMGKHARVAEAVRFKFQIDGLKFAHYSRWMSFSYNEKSGLYKKYMVSLVEGITPDSMFDIDDLKGMRVKMVWQNDPGEGGYQSIQLIIPEGQKINQDDAPEKKESPDSEVPF